MSVRPSQRVSCEEERLSYVGTVRLSVILTRVDEASWRSFAELFGFVGQRDLNDPGDVTRGCLDPNGVRGDQLMTQTQTERITGGTLQKQIVRKVRGFSLFLMNQV